ncbi:unnamed protein product [Durusdinium trenchii]|uniref:Uncharacterized protein n=1 Tax=Durusdinium trenchii TaxID=1381693 RepID=A0ABP0JWP6_9DINO
MDRTSTGLRRCELLPRTYVCENLVKPLTFAVQHSFAELVGSTPTPVQWFVSHFWGSAFRHFSETVQKHAAQVALEPDSVAYWVCTFSNNQWAVDDELGHGEVCQSSFYLALRSRSCRGTVMVIDELAMPLTRVFVRSAPDAAALAEPKLRRSAAVHALGGLARWPCWDGRGDGGRQEVVPAGLEGCRGDLAKGQGADRVGGPANCGRL